MKNQVHIEQPCSISWEGMAKANKGRHCGACNKVVMDFRNKTAAEIRAYFEKPANQDACGRYQRRHTTSASRWERMLNRLESLAAGGTTRRIVVLAISSLLLISSCSRRVVMGRKMSRSHRHASSKTIQF